MISSLLTRNSTDQQQNSTRTTSNANRFQVRIPPSTTEEDRRAIVRYVNTFAEYTDRIIRRHSSRNGNTLHVIDPENLRRSIMIQMADHSFTFSNTLLTSFVQTIGAEMIVAFINHARLLGESYRGSQNGSNSNRLTIYIVHERYISHINQSTNIPSTAEDESLNSHLELRSRLMELRARIERDDDSVIREATHITTSDIDNTDILQDLQRTLSRLRSSTSHFSVNQRNVRRRTIVNEEEEEFTHTNE